jgi:hypothetical protein
MSRGRTEYKDAPQICQICHWVSSRSGPPQEDGWDGPPSSPCQGQPCTSEIINANLGPKIQTRVPSELYYHTGHLFFESELAREPVRKLGDKCRAGLGSPSSICGIDDTRGCSQATSRALEIRLNIPQDQHDLHVACVDAICSAPSGLRLPQPG